jgi:hypothetical protein
MECSAGSIRSDDRSSFGCVLLLVCACAELQIPLHVFTWQPETRRAGFLRTASYLLRPDGYVALADPA